jgi:hypothetical protein
VASNVCDRLEEVLLPLLPGTEQFRLQHKRAIETAGDCSADWARLQQSGILLIGQELSCRCPPVPVTPITMVPMSKKDASHLIIFNDYIDRTTSVSIRSIYANRAFLVARKFRRQKLEGDQPSQLQILSQINVAHPTFAE